MERKFDAYVLWPLAKRVKNWIVDRFTARNFMVLGFVYSVEMEGSRWCQTDGANGMTS